VTPGPGSDAPAIPWPARADVAGTPISLTTYEEVLDLLGRDVPAGRTATYAFCNVHAVMTARRDAALAAALAGLDVTAPDGMPLRWWLQRSGHALPDRVYGPDLMALALRHGVERGWRHALYGTTEQTLAALQARIAADVPGCEVVTAIAPPFGPSPPDLLEAHLTALVGSGATHVWVALGMPKQELWVHRHAARLAGRHVLAVGAAFDFLAGVVPQAPDWMQDRGLEWAHRLAADPRRLAGRYLRTNPAYLALLGRHALRSRRARTGTHA
jgi:N-acetylglucosaminyldiphosphoundecaprenol N-acetyl-beta-D-mannosaminyltransferase